MRQTKCYEYNFHGVHKLRFVLEQYVTGNIAVEAVSNTGEPYATVSVNFPGVLDDAGDQFICLDTNNLPDETVKLLKKENIIEETGRQVLGDFGNTYPICKVNLELFK